MEEEDEEEEEVTVEEEEEEEEAWTSSACVHVCACVRIYVTGPVNAGIWPVCQCERRQLTRSRRPSDGARLSAGVFLTSHPAPRPARAAISSGPRRSKVRRFVHSAQSPLARV